MMDAKLAAKIMYADSDAATINEKAAEYATLQSSVESAARRGYVDTIIEAEDTRKICDRCFRDALYKERGFVQAKNTEQYNEVSINEAEMEKNCQSDAGYNLCIFSDCLR